MRLYKNYNEYKYNDSLYDMELKIKEMMTKLPLIGSPEKAKMMNKLITKKEKA